jgi:hypothetical protein
MRVRPAAGLVQGNPSVGIPEPGAAERGIASESRGLQMQQATRKGGLAGSKRSIGIRRTGRLQM